MVLVLRVTTGLALTAPPSVSIPAPSDNREKEHPVIVSVPVLYTPRIPLGARVSNVIFLSVRMPSFTNTLSASEVVLEKRSPMVMVEELPVMVTSFEAAISICVSQEKSASRSTVITFVSESTTAVMRSGQDETAMACLEASPNDSRPRAAVLRENTIEGERTNTAAVGVFYGAFNITKKSFHAN